MTESMGFLLAGMALGSVLALSFIVSLRRQRRRPGRQAYLQAAFARAQSLNVQAYLLLIEIEVSAAERERVLHALLTYMQHCTRKEEPPLRWDEKSVAVVLLGPEQKLTVAIQRLRERLQFLRVLDTAGELMVFQWEIKVQELSGARR